MCKRYVSPSNRAIEQYWHVGVRNTGVWIQSFNVAPTTMVPIVKLDDNGEAEVVPARWGLIPLWWKQPKPPALSFNVRSEDAARKPMWRNCLQTQRCLMPAAGWYEWQEQQGHKQPYFLHDASNEVLAMAGLWAEWKAPDGQAVTSCALLTKSAAPAIYKIHRRMPVILAPEQFDRWLSPGTPSSTVQELIADARQDFSGYAVRTWINSTRNEGPELLEPVDVKPVG